MACIVLIDFFFLYINFNVKHSILNQSMLICIWKTEAKNNRKLHFKKTGDKKRGQKRTINQRKKKTEN